MKSQRISELEERYDDVGAPYENSRSQVSAPSYRSIEAEKVLAALSDNRRSLGWVPQSSRYWR